jgi:hypothetical protein
MNIDDTVKTYEVLTKFSENIVKSMNYNGVVIEWE